MDTVKVRRRVIHKDCQLFFDSELREYLEWGWRVTAGTYQVQLKEPAGGEYPSKYSYFVQVENGIEGEKTMKDVTLEQAQLIAAKVAEAATTAAAGMVQEGENLPVTINIFIIEHGGNWNIGDAAMRKAAAQ